MWMMLAGCISLAPPCEEVGEGWLDADGDGFGAGGVVTACAEQVVQVDGDCDDGDPAAWPGAPETWYDGVLQDCAGRDDDRDGDGVGVDEDCDDDDAAVFPGAEETWYDGEDQDCGGGSDYDRDGDGADSDRHGGDDCDDLDPDFGPQVEETWYDGVDSDCDEADDYDQDGDGHRAIGWGDDCDDERADVFPDATEVCDGLDQDCDEVADEGFDADGDGFVACLDDCDDAAADVSPGAAETCDGRDEDCDGEVDEDFDADLDGWATCGGDCDDLDGDVHPGAPEAWYDGVDADCDGASDYDRDGDGADASEYGGADCDDADAAYGPGAAEPLDGEDQDCDGRPDDAVASDVAAAVVRGDTADQHVGSGGARFADDLDGDGEDELVLASPDDGTDGGAVWLFGSSELSASGTVADAWLTLEGSLGDEVGAAIAAGLDWDADGTGEVGVGAPGRVSVYVTEPASAGSRTQAASSLAYATLIGATASDFGAALAVGDLDGDGVTDLAVGAPGTSKGAVYLFTGGAGAASATTSAADQSVTGADTGDAIGAVLGGGGDTDGDGYDDVCVGVPGDDENGRSGSGSVFLVRGAAVYVNLGLSIEAVASWTLTGSAAGQAVGTDCVLADVASSSDADILVAAEGYSGGGYTGAVGVFYGASSGSESFSAADRLVRGGGGAVSGGADLDMDGATDLLVGGDGAAWIVSLATAGTLDVPDDAPGYWTESGSELGAALDGDARDLDADGVDDVVVAAPAEVGAAYLLRVFP